MKIFFIILDLCFSTYSMNLCIFSFLIWVCQNILKFIFNTQTVNLWDKLLTAGGLGIFLDICQKLIDVLVSQRCPQGCSWISLYFPQSDAEGPEHCSSMREDGATRSLYLKDCSLWESWWVFVSFYKSFYL